jgi:hypothetical protein
MFSDEQRQYLRTIIGDVKSRFDREMDQGLLKRDLWLAFAAMSGRDACLRIEQELNLRARMEANRDLLEELAAAASAGQKRLLRGRPVSTANRAWGTASETSGRKRA